MEKLNVRFSDETKAEIAKLADMSGKTYSDTARSAMTSGLELKRWVIEKAQRKTKVISGGIFKQD